MQYVWMLLAAIAADAPARYEIVAPKGDGVIATGINGRGDLIGFEMVEEVEHPGVLAQSPFYAEGGKRKVALPVLKGYTATFPAGISDGGLVVGRSSKPFIPGRRVHLLNQAFVWDEAGGMRGLGAPEGDWSSFATGVARDGARIAGFAVGEDRVRACVWDRDGDGWKATVLPHDGQLGSQVVAISGDGRRVAAVDGVVPRLWSLGDDGRWTREALGAAGSLIPRGVNDEGMVVGLRNDPDGLIHAVVWTRAEGLKSLPEPAGYAKSEASAVNNRGVVVGMVDGPNGSEIGPNAFAYENGRMHLIDEPGSVLGAATAINDRNQVAGIAEEREPEPEPEPAPAKPRF